MLKRKVEALINQNKVNHSAFLDMACLLVQLHLWTNFIFFGRIIFYLGSVILIPGYRLLLSKEFYLTPVEIAHIVGVLIVRLLMHETPQSIRHNRSIQILLFLLCEIVVWGSYIVVVKEFPAEFPREAFNIANLHTSNIIFAITYLAFTAILHPILNILNHLNLIYHSAQGAENKQIKYSAVLRATFCIIGLILLYATMVVPFEGLNVFEIHMMKFLLQLPLVLYLRWMISMLFSGEEGKFIKRFFTCANPVRYVKIFLFIPPLLYILQMIFDVVSNVYFYNEFRAWMNDMGDLLLSSIVPPESVVMLTGALFFSLCRDAFYLKQQIDPTNEYLPKRKYDEMTTWELINLRNYRLTEVIKSEPERCYEKNNKLFYFVHVTSDPIPAKNADEPNKDALV